MDLYFYFAIFIFVILFVLLLPVLSGIGGFKIGQRNSSNHNSDHRLKFKLSKEQGTGRSSSREYEIDSKTGLKKRVIGNYNEDPNTYDYDLDEIINADDDYYEQNPRPKVHV